MLPNQSNDDMARARDLLQLILEKASAAEPVSIARVLEGDGKRQIAVLWRDEFKPPLDPAIELIVKEKLSILESGGGVADLTTIDVCGTPVRVALEVVRPKLKLVIFGAGHVGQAVALIGVMLGYRVLVIDDRKEFASRKRLPDPRIELLVSDFGEGAKQANITPGTAVVIVTRGHQSDETCLKSVVRSRASYLGMIGSRKRVLAVFKQLIGQGYSQDELNRVRAPIGIKIGARTPQEIAIAILAEIIRDLNGPNSERGETTHGI